jgi:hypothetical protein
MQPWTELASGLRNINCSSTLEYIIHKIYMGVPRHFSRGGGGRAKLI